MDNKVLFGIMCIIFNCYGVPCFMQGNVEKGVKVVCACVNAIMPNGQLITAGKLRGVDSYGMLCSEYELGLIEEHKRGLLLLDDSYQVGECFEGGK